MKKIIFSARFIPLFLASLTVGSGIVQSQSRLLDDFEDISGWKAIPSEGARMNLTTGKGTAGNALILEFDFTGVFGYAIAQKDFSVDLPKNYRFTFDLKADIPVNNFEFKLLDENGNVYWIKKQNIEFPKDWQKQKIKKRHIQYAWGPAGGGEIRRVSKIEFVVSTGTGGAGKIFIDNFTFEPMDDDPAKTATAVFMTSPEAKKSNWEINQSGTVLRSWNSERTTDWISIDFQHLKELGGIVIDWEKDRHADSYDILITEDGTTWNPAYEVRGSNGGRDYLYLPELDARALRIEFHKDATGKGYSLDRLEIQGPEFSSTPNDFFSTVAREVRPGNYPEYFLGRQCYWTIVGVSGDTKEALINEAGAIEIDKERFSLEPFLFTDGKLITWHDVTISQSLEKDYLPVPSVHWSAGTTSLRIRAFAAGPAGRSYLVASYELTNPGARAATGELFIALRPFQVNPPSQWLNTVGGFAPIDSIENKDSFVMVHDKAVIPLSPHSGFGATNFDRGDIIEYLERGTLPASRISRDRHGFASGAFRFSYHLEPKSSKEAHIVIPFHSLNDLPAEAYGPTADRFVRESLDSTIAFWERNVGGINIHLPDFAQPIVHTIKSNLAYIFINRDGPGIQPGSRSYERSWIRDGSLTSTALLQLGIKDEVREYIDWYARYQYPNGKIPCVVDHRGADPTNEHDSHGQFIYLVKQYFNFTRDSSWLRGKFEQVVKTVRFLQSLRAERKTELYRSGTPEQRACFGLVPESISHEGYSAHPMHSYWDNFFVLRGFKDAAAIAAILGEKGLAKEFAAEVDDMRASLYASMRLAMQTRKIDYIPGCVELGDFDATSTTIGIHPADELGSIPEPQLHRTFDKYYEYFKARKERLIEWRDYTPYETRVIGTFVLLGQKTRAHEALEFFMNDRRPSSWNHWAEVVHRDPETPKFIGDMPHTWCGSDFMRSVRTMFVYERERDASIVVGAGIPETWVNDPAGVEVRNLQTYYGPISYTMKRKGATVTVTVAGEIRFASGPGGSATDAVSAIIVRSPLDQPPLSARVDGRKVSVEQGQEIALRKLPSIIEFQY